MPVQGEGVELKGEVLVIALRDSANLVALRGTTTSPVMKEGSAPLQFTEYRVPLNEQEWDTPASFSALSLAVSTDSVALETANAKKGVCGPLAVSTDKGAHLLVAWGGLFKASSTRATPRWKQRWRLEWAASRAS